jgi:nitrile hydratase
MTDSVHDMGGMDGFGAVQPEPNEPAFHAKWEGRVLALVRAMTAGGAWTIDRSRAAQEMLAPDVYLRASYYARWALGLQTNVLEFGLVEADEIAAGHALRAGTPLKRKLTPDDVKRGLTRGCYDRPAAAPPRLAIGDRVRARNIHPKTHTRLPRYVRGRVGVVERVQGCHVFPDTAAIGEREDAQWLYTVVFDGRELWGDDADPTLTVSIEAFESYLEPI